MFRARPAEFLHSAPCFANALRCAVENFSEARDAHDFFVASQDGTLHREAVEYLTSGMADCRCTGPCGCTTCEKWADCPYCGYCSEPPMGD